MKWVFFYIILCVLYFSGFLAQGRVVCASPQTGLAKSEAKDVNSVCEPSATGADGVDRDVNVGQIAYNVTADGATPEESTSQKDKKGVSGATR